MAGLELSYVHGASDRPLIGKTVGQFFDEACATWAARPALVVRHQKVRLSYGELRQAVDKLAAGLLTLGLKPGDRIGIWSPNNSEWVLTQFATAKAGLILVNINPSYRIAELEYALVKVGCKALILAERFKTSDYIGMLRELAPELKEAQPGQLAAARLPSLRSVILLGDSWHPGTFRFSEIMERGGLIDDNLITDIVRARLERPDAAAGFLLDGYPRTVPQGRALDEFMTGKAPLTIVEIVLSEAEILRRLAARMICSECGVNSQDDRDYANCVNCGGRLVPRADDAQEVVRNRIAVYHRQTAPLVDYYGGRPTYYRVEGAQLADTVTENILDAVARVRGA